MSNLMSIRRNGSKSNSDLRYGTFPTWSSWIDEVFNKNFGQEFVSNFNTGMTLPAVNVIDRANEYIVEVAIPGLKKTDFDINLDNQLLSISAEINKESATEDESYTRREFGYASFKRTFSLPKTVKTEKIKAKYEDGVLKVLLPKRDEAKKKPVKQIEIL